MKTTKDLAKDPARLAMLVSNVEPPWMAGFGALAAIADENRQVLKLIEKEFDELPQP